MGSQLVPVEGTWKTYSSVVLTTFSTGMIPFPLSSFLAFSFVIDIPLLLFLLLPFSSLIALLLRLLTLPHAHIHPNLQIPISFFAYLGLVNEKKNDTSQHLSVNRSPGKLNPARQKPALRSRTSSLSRCSSLRAPAQYL